MRPDIALGTRGAADDRLTLRVTDDGTGFSVPSSEGPGIRGMRERALLVGGRLHIGPAGQLHNDPGHRGTTVRLDCTDLGTLADR